MDETLQFNACACFNIKRTARVVAQAYEKAMESTGLTNTQFSALAVLSEAAPVTITELSRITETERTTLTRNLKLLVRDGLVAINPGTDPRARLVSLTAAGRARLEQAAPLWAKTQAAVLRGFGEQNWLDMQRQLQALADSARSA
jgi:DNA-binding MarR family transcriptional regulator